eukprot:7387157-Prymnesium_polylepis.1
MMIFVVPYAMNSPSHDASGMGAGATAAAREQVRTAAADVVHQVVALLVDLEQADRVERARVVHDHVDLAKRLDDLLDSCLHLLLFRQVALHREALAAHLADLPHDVAQGARPRLDVAVRPAEHRHASARHRKPHGHPLADASRRAADDARQALEAEHRRRFGQDLAHRMDVLQPIAPHLLRFAKQVRRVLQHRHHTLGLRLPVRLGDGHLESGQLRGCGEWGHSRARGDILLSAVCCRPAILLSARAHNLCSAPPTPALCGTKVLKVLTPPENGDVHVSFQAMRTKFVNA